MKAVDTFSTIESTQEFLSCLSKTIDEVLDDARRQLSGSSAVTDREDVKAWQLILYTTTKLSSHIENSRKLMKNLGIVKTILDRNAAI
jgi:hypothetical protein